MYTLVPGFQTWLFWSYSGVYPGSGYHEVYTLLNGDVPGYRHALLLIESDGMF